MCWGVEDELDPRSRQAPVVPELCQLTQRKFWWQGGKEGNMVGKVLVSLMIGRDLEYRVASPSPLT